MDPIRIFIGTEPKTEIMRQVLEFSIRRRTKRPVEFTPMIGPAWEYPIDGISVGTGFSLRRWLIPQACNYQGRAIYLDADQLVLADIGELWDMPETRPSPGASTWLTMQPDKFSKNPWPQSSVMVIDCARAYAEWGYHRAKMLDYLQKTPGRPAYVNFQHCTWMLQVAAGIPTEWNHLNLFVRGKTKLLHYTSEPSQPHVQPDHPLAAMWQKELREAIQAGAVDRDLFEDGLTEWGILRDWRKTNGLHPYYKRFLTFFKLPKDTNGLSLVA